MNEMTAPDNPPLYRLLINGLAMLLFAAAPLAGCSGPASPPAQPPLQGAKLGGPFELVDQDGHVITDRAFAGRYRILYFGYTFCPDVCPVDVQKIGAAMRLLDARNPAVAARIVPIFVTIDPARDTPAVLKAFVRAFHPRMIGLTGSAAAIDAVAKEYAIYYHKGDVSPGGGYMMDHSRVAYLMGPDGKPIALLPQEQSPEAIAAEIERWVK